MEVEEEMLKYWRVLRALSQMSGEAQDEIVNVVVAFALDYPAPLRRRPWPPRLAAAAGATLAGLVLCVPFLLSYE